ncbi:MAG: hypothetical protein KDA30_08325 [Phycisphaerales bacterium]|nr:hypothetical protein [Phycisphaerales bacterium]
MSQVHTPLPNGTLCPQCGYDLGGLVAGRCPECGFDVSMIREVLHARREFQTKVAQSRFLRYAFNLMVPAAYAAAFVHGAKYEFSDSKMVLLMEAGIWLYCLLALSEFGGWVVSRCIAARDRRVVRSVWSMNNWVFHLPWLVSPIAFLFFAVARTMSAEIGLAIVIGFALWMIWLVGAVGVLLAVWSPRTHGQLSQLGVCVPARFHVVTWIVVSCIWFAVTVTAFFGIGWSFLLSDALFPTGWKID